MSAEEVVLSPNPVTSELRLIGMPEGATIEVFNTSGNLIPPAHLNENTLDVSQLFPGIYFVRIEKNGELAVKRFIKE